MTDLTAEAYKRATAAPDAFSAAEIEDTLRVLRERGSSLARVVEEAPRVRIPKPDFHAGGPETDYFQVHLPVEALEALLQELLDAEAAASTPEGEATPEARHRAGLVDRWGACRRWKTGG